MISKAGSAALSSALALLSSGALAQSADSIRAAAPAACNAAPDIHPTIDGISIEQFATEAGDLPGLRITVDRTGATMVAFYDAASESAARSRAACVGAELDLVGTAVGDDRTDAAWFDAVFTTDDSYTPPRAEGAKARWTIKTDADGALTTDAERRLLAVQPHEQTHAYQGRNGGRTPRWFHEGHATWVGQRITAVLNPDLAAAELERSKLALRETPGPLNLGGWGGMSVKPEAIQRQLSAEDRARMAADPTFRPAGPFSFGPDDLISDESNTFARYGAAALIFKGLAERHGADAVTRWVSDATISDERVTTAQLVASAQEAFGEDLTPLLQ